EAFGPDGHRGVRGGLEVSERRRRVRSTVEECEDVARGRGVDRKRQPVGRRRREVEGRARLASGRRRLGRETSGRKKPDSESSPHEDGPEKTPRLSQGSPPEPAACRKGP